MENLRSIEARNRLFNFTFDVVKWFKYKSVDVKNFWKRRKKKNFWKNEKNIASRLFLSDPPYTQTNAKNAWITFFGSNTTVILLKQKKKKWQLEMRPGWYSSLWWCWFFTVFILQNPSSYQEEASPQFLKQAALWGRNLSSAKGRSLSWRLWHCRKYWPRECQ